MSGIMSMFSNLMGGSPAPAPAATTAPTVPGNIPPNAAATAAASPNTAPNGAVPAIGTGNATPPATPLDQFNDLWKTAPTDPNAPPKQEGVFGNVDPKKFMEAAGKIDFSKAVTPEQLQAMSQGGEGAIQAFAAALNQVAQNTYAQSAFATTKIVEQALARSKDSFLTELPNHIKKQTVFDNLRTENPIFSNPAVQPIISALEAQMTVKYPNASATEITNLAKQYVEALGTSFSPKPAVPETKGKGKDETDWSSFLQ